MKTPSCAPFQSKDEAAEQLTFSKKLQLLTLSAGFLTDLRNSLLTADTKEENKSMLIQHPALTVINSIPKIKPEHYSMNTNRKSTSEVEIIMCSVERLSI